MINHLGLAEAVASGEQHKLQASPLNQAGVQLQKARELAAGGRLQDAEAILDHLLQLNPQDLPALIEKGHCRRRCGDHPGAAATFEQASRIAPNHPGIKMELVHDLRALARHDEADVVVDSVLADQPQHVGALIDKALSRRRAGDHETAAALLQAASRTDPAHLGIKMELARDLRSLGREAQAAKLVDAVLAVDPRHVAALAEKGHALRRSGDHAGAAEWFQAAADIDPTHMGIKLELARDLRAAGRHDEAERIIDAILAIQPRHIAALAEKAASARAAGKPRLAAELLRTASKADPQHLGIRLELARDLRALGQHDDADALVESVLAFNPRHAWALVEKAHAQRRAGNHAAAVEAFQTAARLEPHHRGIKLELARALRAVDRTGEALTLLSDLAGAAPDDIAAGLALASLLTDIGRFDEAYSRLDVLAASAPGNPGILREMALLARRRGDRLTSRSLFERAARADPRNLELKLDVATELRDAGELDGARTFIEAVLRADPQHFGAWMQLGHLHRANGNRNGAERAFTRANEINPATPEPLQELAHERWSMGQPGEATKLLDEAIARDARAIGPLLVRAEYALSAEDPEAALDFALRARAINPRNLGPYLLGARAHAAMIDFGAGLALLKEAETVLGLKPEIAATQIFLLRQTRDDDEGIRSILARARVAGLSSFGLWLESAMFAIMIGDFDAVDAGWTTAPAMTQRERAQVHMARGLAAEGRRDYVAAIAAYRQAIALWPAVGGWHSELARCHLLIADTDMARSCLAESMRRDRSMRQVRGQSDNISQHHIGQLLDEFTLDRTVLEQLQAIVPLPPAEQLAPLRRLVAEEPDATAPAMMLLLAARQANCFGTAAAPSDGPAAIPRTLVQFWDSDVPSDITALMQSWQRLNPEFRHCLFNTDSAEAFIAAHHGADVLAAFRRTREPAQRSDLFRLAFLATEGGFYVDADDRCLQPLSSFIPAATRLAVYQENYGTLGNNFIGATPAHPVIARALALAAQAINRGDKDMVWLLTGPGLLTRAFASVAAAEPGLLRSPDILVMELWQMQRVAGLHCPARYKRTTQHWSRALFGASEGRRAKAGLIRLQVTPSRVPAD